MKSFFDLFDEYIEYPKNLAEEGVTQGTLLAYVSLDYLNGFVNYVEPFFVCVIERYRDWTKTPLDNLISLVEKAHHTDYSTIDDDIIILAKTKNSLWFFWSDKDVSDCQIGRISNTIINQDDFIQKLIDWITSHQYVERPFQSEAIVGNYKELALPTGWITL